MQHGRVTVAWENEVTRALMEDPSMTTRVTDKDRINGFEVAWKPVAGFSKAVRAASLEHSMEGILVLNDRDAPRLDGAEMERVYSERGRSADSWPDLFDDDFADPEHEWDTAATKKQMDMGGIIQHFELELTPRFSYEFRVRAVNGYGEWSDWSDESRPVYVPTVPHPRPQRPNVPGLSVKACGGGYQASTGELKRFILGNLKADQVLGQLYTEWSKKQLWGTVRDWSRNSALARTIENRELAKLGHPPSEARRISADWVGTGGKAGRETLTRVKTPDASKRSQMTIAGAAVRLSRSVWVPIAESACAGRPTLLALLPKSSSVMAGSFRHDKHIRKASRSPAKGVLGAHMVVETEGSAAGGAGDSSTPHYMRSTHETHDRPMGLQPPGKEVRGVDVPVLKSVGSKRSLLPGGAASGKGHRGKSKLPPLKER